MRVRACVMPLTSCAALGSCPPTGWLTYRAISGKWLAYGKVAADGDRRTAGLHTRTGLPSGLHTPWLHTPWLDTLRPPP